MGLKYITQKGFNALFAQAAQAYLPHFRSTVEVRTTLLMALFSEFEEELKIAEEELMSITEEEEGDYKEIPY